MCVRRIRMCESLLERRLAVISSSSRCFRVYLIPIDILTSGQIR